MIYVAASWRTKIQPEVVRWLREAGHEVYDFRNPAPGVYGFAWREIDGGWENWTPEQYRAALRHPIAQLGFSHDENALHASDTCVLVLPSGRSAHTEAGWMKGAGARVVVFIPEQVEPELMYLLFDEIALTKDELLLAAATSSPTGAVQRSVEEMAKHLRRRELPLLGSNQDSPDPEGV